jgi:hypothetical protein
LKHIFAKAEARVLVHSISELKIEGSGSRAASLLVKNKVEHPSSKVTAKGID